jgi:hypothetical protein
MEASRLMRILRIRNFEKYQHRIKTQNAPWIKLYTKLLCDIDFLKLDVDARYLYIGLLILASETGNSTVNDPSYLCHRLAIDRSRFNLTPLFRSGLLVASQSTIRREREREREKPKKGDREGDNAATPPKPQLSRRDKLELFELSDEDRCWAKEELDILNPDDYVPEFKDYWRGVDDKKLKSSWLSTFRNRLRYLKANNQLKQSVW